ncbi:MAG: UbiA prenyltransferase family protein [Promethearchaeota archaeon]
MAKICDIIDLVRVRQWYKGVVIFAGLVFGGKIADLSVYIPLFIGFFAICLASSFNYIFNDLRDVEKDRHHEEKSKRPIPSGRISKKLAILLMIGIILIVFVLSTFVMNLFIDAESTWRFDLMVIAILINGFLYNIYLKNHAFLDIITLSLIYIWRTIAGIWILNISLSPWLYLLIFQVAMFLSISKRKADKEFCGENATKHKKIYEKYTDEVIKSAQNLITVSLFMTYLLYVALAPMAGFSGPELNNNRGFILFSVPIMMYIIMRFLYLANTQPHIARSPEKAFKDLDLVIAGIILLIFIFVGNYVRIVWFI